MHEVKKKILLFIYDNEGERGVTTEEVSKGTKMEWNNASKWCYSLASQGFVSKSGKPVRFKTFAKTKRYILHKEWRK